MHIEHAEVMVCEDEFKYSLLANNCICPGISSFITLLMHTSRGEEGQKSKEPWHKVYGFHSGNEIYDIVVGESKFFGEFVGRSFTFASFTAHKVYGVNLIGVKSAGLNEPIRLNPGHTYFLKATDTAYYIALTNEESLTNFRKSLTRQQRKANIASTIANIGTVALEVPSAKKTSFKSRTMKIKNRLLKHKDNDEEQVNLIGVPANFGLRKSSVGVVVDAEIENPDSETESICTECEGVCMAEKLRKTVPPLTSYVGASFTVCHILKEKRPICCLELCSPCEHCAHQTADEYKWTRPAIIVAADQTCSGLYNLIIPLRAYYRPVHSLQPIILLLELQDDGTPRKAFLDVIAWFPMVYWMEGKISSLDNLLKAGVCLADNVVVVKEGTTDVEEHLADCTTIITVQKIHRMFPRLRMITELTHQTNMRFMQFDADDDYALEQSKFEKKERKRGSTMSFMFRLPFAAGGVFSANMLDRLLYQAFVKEYVVDFLRLLLGIDQSEGSGYLTSFTITKEDIWIRTYGRLYQKLCSSVADIPIGVYRTKEISSRKSSRRISLDINISPKVQISIQRRKNETKREISALVQYRMQNLGMSVDNYELKHYTAHPEIIPIDCNDRKGTVSYVIINPSFDLELEAGDIVYVLRPPVPQETANTNIVNPRRGLKRVTSEPQLSPDTHILTSANVTEVNVNDEDGASDDQSKGEKEKH
ncbi:hypothetical protein AB6A40_006201 [Gnathostoma spinigerum]|uniref:Uncharacterized protein n=1 Tax=Gnathostoma spinigerum TaxID=75299 RepID=A0ABD6ESG5_9BILA